MESLYLTIVNERYALRALVLYKSLLPYLGNKRFVVYCVDDGAVRVLENMREKSLLVVAPDDFEDADLLSLKNERPINAYCWMCKPVILEHALARFPDAEWAVYLDSDMMAFADPDEGLPSESDANVVLTPHRPSDDYFSDFIPTVGHYNAGYVAFRNTEIGRSALHWWRDRCVEYCPGAPVDGVYADQKYLDDVAVNFSGVHASGHAGLNAGPWNILGYRISMRDNKVFVNDDALLLYHMQAFHIFGRHLFDAYKGSVRMPSSVRRCIYRPYQNLIANSWKTLTDANAGFRQDADSSLWRMTTLFSELKKLIRGISNLSVRF